MTADVAAEPGGPNHGHTPDTDVLSDPWQYTRSADGTRIAWRRDAPGSGLSRSQTPVVLCNGIACSTAYWTALASALARQRPVVQWDYRGHGRSGPPVRRDAVAVNDVVDDLRAVMAAAAIDDAVIAGHSYGVQVALEAARALPDRVAAVVAVAGAAGTPLSSVVTRSGIGPIDLLERAHATMPGRSGVAWRAWWRSPWIGLLARALGGTSTRVPADVMAAYYHHVAERDVGVLTAMLRAMADHDAFDVVRSLTVPLLVLAGDADRLTTLPVMSRMALAAPEGELVVCHGATHTLPAEQPEWVAGQLRPLLARIDGRRRRRTTAPRGEGSTCTRR